MLFFVNWWKIKLKKGKIRVKEYFEALSADTEMNLFISYKWNEMSEKEADKVCEWLSTYQINPIRDK